VLRINADIEADRARRAFESHLLRARWMTEQGYRPARLTSHSLKPRLKSFQEVVGLPKLNGKIINASLGETPGFFLIKATNINPACDTAARPDDVGSIFFHRTPPVLRLEPQAKVAREKELSI
jgi:hypothetical protein